MGQQPEIKHVTSIDALTNSLLLGEVVSVMFGHPNYPKNVYGMYGGRNGKKMYVCTNTSSVFKPVPETTWVWRRTHNFVAVPLQKIRRVGCYKRTLDITVKI